MKTVCGVIRDLLPLYAERMTGEESDALIQEHLAECPDCAKYLESLRNPIDDDRHATSSSDNSLMLVRKGIRSRKATAVLFSVSIVLAVMMIAFSYIVEPSYVSYQSSGIAVVESGNGDVYARFSDSVTSCKVSRSVNEDNRSVVEIEAWTSLWDRILGKATPSVLISSTADKADVVYYCDLSTEADNMTVVYGTDAGENISVLPRLVLGYYFLAALAAAAVFGLAGIMLRRSKGKGRVCGYLFAAALSYILAQLINTTGFVSYSAANGFVMNCITALAICGVLIFGNSLLRQHRQDMLAEQAEA